MRSFLAVFLAVMASPAQAGELKGFVREGRRPAWGYTLMIQKEGPRGNMISHVVRTQSKGQYRIWQAEPGRYNLFVYDENNKLYQRSGFPQQVVVSAKGVTSLDFIITEKKP